MKTIFVVTIFFTASLAGGLAARTGTIESQVLFRQFVNLVGEPVGSFKGCPAGMSEDKPGPSDFFIGSRVCRNRETGSELHINSEGKKFITWIVYLRPVINEEFPTNRAVLKSLGLVLGQDVPNSIELSSLEENPDVRPMPRYETRTYQVDFVFPPLTKSIGFSIHHSAAALRVPAGGINNLVGVIASVEVGAMARLANDMGKGKSLGWKVSLAMDYLTATQVQGGRVVYTGVLNPDIWVIYKKVATHVTHGDQRSMEVFESIKEVSTNRDVIKRAVRFELEHL